MQQRCHKTGIGYELDVEGLRPDGSKLWLTTRGRTMRDANAHMVRLRGTIQDITVCKRGVVNGGDGVPSIPGL